MTDDLDEKSIRPSERSFGAGRNVVDTLVMRALHRADDAVEEHTLRVFPSTILVE